MLRPILSAIAFVGVLAALHPAFADPVVAMSPEYAQSGAAATERAAPSAPARSPSSDAPPPASAAPDRGTVPAGFGWG